MPIIIDHVPFQMAEKVLPPLQIKIPYALGIPKCVSGKVRIDQTGIFSKES